MWLMMLEHISDSELERMNEFAKTPVYARRPEQLLPEDAVVEE